MTVPSEVSRSGPYNGNGVTTAFNYGFRIIDASHVRVVKTVVATGVETVLTLDVHYSVSGVGNEGGGNVTLFVAPPAGETITNVRDVPFTQETDLENQGAYYAETVETALDLAVMRDQELKEVVDRAVTVPYGETGLRIDRIAEGHFWKADADSNMVDGGDADDIANAQSYAAQVAANTALVLQARSETLAAVQALNFTSIAALRAFAGVTVATAADVVGYYASTRVGGGRFNFDATDVVTADDGGNVIVDAAGRRWKRVNPQYQVTDFGARPYSSGMDAGPAFAVAQAAAVAAGSPVRASGEYLINTSIPMAGGVTWQTTRLTLRTTAAVINIFNAVAVNDWQILGGPVFRGTLAAPLIDFVAGSLIAPYATGASVTVNPLQYDQTAPDDQNGIRIVDCRRYIVENPQGYDLAGACISRAHSAGAGNPRADKGTIIAPFARNCVFGMISVESGAGAEYCSIVNPSITGCIVGDAMGAGNQTISGGSITDNWVNKYISGGAGNNHAHGIDSGVQFNHGVHLGVLASSVTNGHSIVGCHIYGNGLGKGAIWFLDSKNVHVMGGVVDCYVYSDNGPNAGFNYVRNNHFQGDYGAVLLTQVTSGAELIVSTGNTGPGANKDNNTPHPLYVLVRRETTMAATAAGTVLTFPIEISDRMQRHTPGTGTFAIPTGMTGTYRIEAHLVFGGVAVDATASYVELKINGVVKAIALPGKFSTTMLVFDFVEELLLTAGDTVTLTSSIAASSGQVFGNTAYRSTVSLAKIG